MILTFPRREDLKWMIEDVKNARAKVDVVIVSFHWGIHFIPAVIPMYCFDVGYAAIDAGADLILGHHAHMLKGIEVYKGKVIFHSLGNFALELKSSAVTHFLNTVVKKLYGFEPDPNYPTVPFHPDFKYTMIAKIIISGGKITRVSYLPCLINTNAEPVIYERNTKEAQETFNYVERISRDQNLNVCYSWEGDEVVISG
jgi:poly-gamma-glutamate synthesis protein (capsule biosynthesis protein)